MMHLLIGVANDTMATKDFIQSLAMVIGVIISVPTLVLMWKVAMFVGSIKSMVETTAKSLEAHVTKVETILDDYGVRLMRTEKQVAVLWDGKERRTLGDRRGQTDA